MDDGHPQINTHLAIHGLYVLKEVWNEANLIDSTVQVPVCHLQIQHVIKHVSPFSDECTSWLIVSFAKNKRREDGCERLATLKLRVQITSWQT
jgi:hypothetical protein